MSELFECDRCGGRGETTPPAAEFLTVPEVAGTLLVSEKTVYRLARKGELAAVKVGSAVRVSRASIERFVVAHQMGGAA